MVEIIRPDVDILKTALSGQCFRMNKTEDGSFLAVATNKAVKITQQGDRISFFCDEAEFDDFWKPYFDLDSDYEEHHKKIPAEDSFLRAAMEYSYGIRILRQDIWETLISFIISQRKNIPAIKNSVEKLSRMFGEKIKGQDSYSFPEPIKIANAKDEELVACSLGYRVPYVKKTAQLVESGAVNLEKLKTLSDEELMQALCTLPGVGKKVASCVMLFAYHRMEAFPRDVWILRMEDRHYNGSFKEAHYGDSAGLMQQYMFYFGKSLEYKQIFG
ncbi:MAG: DNA glycosylase [Eubacteriales bacterium]|nr:DNA glycosylase [Eubacteriales bacterium]